MTVFVRDDWVDEKNARLKMHASYTSLFNTHELNSVPSSGQLSTVTLDVSASAPRPNNNTAKNCSTCMLATTQSERLRQRVLSDSSRKDFPRDPDRIRDPDPIGCGCFYRMNSSVAGFLSLGRTDDDI